jgi:uncharacterized protein YidB (DUF937 family)
MANPILGQILSSVLGNAMSQRGGSRGGGLGTPGGMGLPGGGMGMPGGMGSGGGGGLGDLLGAMLGGGRGSGMPAGFPGGMGGGLGRTGGGLGGLGMGGGGRNAMLAMLLPLAMQWVQRNGGIGAVLERFKQRGYDRQASSWVSTGQNEALDPQAVGELVGRDEMVRMSQELGVGEDEVADGFAEILPEMVDQLSPQGEVPPDADDVLGGGLVDLQRELGQFR